MVTLADRRILQLLGASDGGIRRHVASLAAALGERGWTVAVAGPPGVMAGIGPQDHDVVVPRGPRALRAVAALGPVLRDVDLVHAHGLTVGWAAAVAPRRPPLVVTVHNLVLDEAEGRLAPVLRRLEGSLPRRADHTIAISEAIASRFRGGVAADRLSVALPIGPVPRPRRTPAEVRAALRVADGVPLVVLVGRLHPQKDVGALLRATATVIRPAVPGVRVVVVGDGPLRARLEAERDRLGLAGTVDLLGAGEGADHLAAADVVVLSSIWESFGFVVSEALQLGRPVVATAVGAVPRMVIDGRTGRLVPIGDPEALGRAVVEVLADPAAAAAMGEAGRRLVLAELDPAGLVDPVEAVYLRLLEARA